MNRSSSTRRVTGWLGLVVATTLLLSCQRGTSGTGSILESGGQKWRVLGGIWETQEGALVGAGGNVESVASFADATLDVDVELLSGPPDRDVGVAFRYDAPGGNVTKVNGYGFNYSHTKTFRVVVGRGGMYRDLATVPAAPRRDAIHVQKNHVRVTLRGTVFDLEVNGERFATFEDATHRSGAVSFWVDSMSSRVRFSNIRIQKL